MVKIIKCLLILIAFSPGLRAQSIKLGLDKAYESARANYPAIKQKDLIQQAAGLTIENLQKGFLPQVNISAQASYQSAVIDFPVTLPGLNFENPSKDQYKLVADVNQLIYDGGVIREQKQLQLLNAATEEEKLQVDLYKLRDRINQLYLGILYLDEQLKQVELVRMDLESGINKVDAQVKNGVAFRSNLNVLKAELLKNQQRVIEIHSSRKGFTDALGLFIGKSLPANIELDRPAFPDPNKEIARPELKMFESQSMLIGQQEKLINSKNLPKASLFVQGGYGKPGLNPLKNGFDAWYIGGIRFNWSLAGLYTKKKEKEIVDINKRIIDLQKESFLLNTNTQLSQQESEIEKLKQLIATDMEIISLRSSVKEAAKAQLDNGVITANDYLREVNAEDQARQSLITHQLQLLQAQINYNTISGN